MELRRIFVIAMLAGALMVTADKLDRFRKRPISTPLAETIVLSERNTLLPGDSFLLSERKKYSKDMDENRLFSFGGMKITEIRYVGLIEDKNNHFRLRLQVGGSILEEPSGQIKISRDVKLAARIDDLASGQVTIIPFNPLD